MTEEIEFSTGDTVKTECDVDITVFDVKITIPQGTKALVHTVRVIPNETTTSRRSIRLFFGFKSQCFDSWAMFYKPIRSRNVLTEKTIDVFRYDTEEKYVYELRRKKIYTRYYDTFVAPKFQQKFV